MADGAMENELPAGRDENNVKELSTGARLLLEELSESERRLIRKEYPSAKQRDALIVSLNKKGVKQTVLAEVSGLSYDTVCRACKAAKARK